MINNVQKIKEEKFMEVQARNSKEQNEYLSTSMEKVLLVGKNIKSALDNPRYTGIFKLFAEMESKLEKALDFDVNINYIVLESLYVTFKQARKDQDTHDGQNQEAIDFYIKYIKPEHFFVLINDISGKIDFNKSETINNKYLSSTALTNIDKFYTEYSDLIPVSIKYNYSLLNLYENVYNKKKARDDQFPNLYTSIRNGSKQERNLACIILNELFNEVPRPHLTESSIDEYYHKVKVIDNRWSEIIKENIKMDIVSIDGLYYEHKKRQEQ